jgi:WD40 repeat protein
VPLSHQRRVWGAVFSADGKRILTWSEDGAARLWHSRSGKALTEPLTHNASVRGATFGKGNMGADLERGSNRPHVG